MWLKCQWQKLILSHISGTLCPLLAKYFFFLLKQICAVHLYSFRRFELSWFCSFFMFIYIALPAPPPPPRQRYTHCQQLSLITTRTQYRDGFFLSHTIRDWNFLSKDEVEAITVDTLCHAPPTDQSTRCCCCFWGGLREGTWDSATI